MIICEFAFNEPNSKRPKYSQYEVDYYAFIPFKMQEKVRNHRLSLRKNLETNEFEVYRFYNDTETEEVIFSSTSLAEAIKFANEQWNKFFSSIDWKKEPEQVCQHKEPIISHSFCPYSRRPSHQKKRGESG
jgi:hypothetical protein